jgi:IS30 family transposase
VSREVSRHRGRPLYRASEADLQAWESALRPKVCLLAIDEKLRTIVARKLILDWSPEQISAWLKVRYPRNALWLAGELLFSHGQQTGQRLALISKH